MGKRLYPYRFRILIQSKQGSDPYQGQQPNLESSGAGSPHHQHDRDPLPPTFKSVFSYSKRLRSISRAWSVSLEVSPHQRTPGLRVRT